jgi:23S rRNA pseudouridine2605 synthase
LAENDSVDGSIRLQLFLARAGIASRRAAEGIIKSGRVAVNGKIVTEMGAKCLPGDTVQVDGIPVARQEALRYVLLNKPSGYLCSAKDDFGRALALDIIQPSFAERLFSVGRLDFESSGLILFTNDGEFARILSHPSSGIEKEYRVKAHTRIPLELAKVFQAGIELDGVRYRAKKCEPLADDEMSIVLVEGKNREIRRVFKDFGLRILSLTRIRIMDLSLGGLAEGSFRELRKQEVDALREAGGEQGGNRNGSGD